MTVVQLDPTLQALQEMVDRMTLERREAEQHPAGWLRHTKAIDAKTGEEFLLPVRRRAGSGSARS